MKLLFKQKFFTWFDSYNIFDEVGNVFFHVQGQLSWGHLFYIYNQNNVHIGTLKEQIFRFLPHFTMFENGNEVGEIIKEFSWFRPKFSLTCSDWTVTGNIWEWDYSIINSKNEVIAYISKQLFNFTDTYVLDIKNDYNALRVLMIVLAIDAIKCNQAYAANQF